MFPTYALLALVFVFGQTCQGRTLAIPDDVDYSEEDTTSFDAEPYKEPREFMIPYPRLGRYMDYATLNALAEYLKQNYNSHGRVDTVTSLYKMAEPSAVLQRELRDMKGKGYGIPIPRVGKRSIQEEAGERIPLSSSSNGRSELTNQSLRAIISEYFRSMENNVKRQQPRTMQFTPRVGRSYPAFSSSNRGRPIPRVGRR